MVDVTTEALESKFLKAHKAGDAKNAAIFAKEIKRRRAGEAAGPGWGEVAQSALVNAPRSAMKNLVTQPLEFMAGAVTDPAGTMQSIVEPMAGGIRAIPGVAAAEKALGGGDDEQTKKSGEAFEKVKQFYGDRYGSMKGFKKALADDPFGPITDAASLMVPAARAPGIARAVAAIPAPVRMAGRIATNPLGEAVGGAGHVLGGTPRLLSSPAEKARRSIFDISERYPNAANDLAQLGPEGIVADVLGAEGRRRGKTASNISPEAQDIIEARVVPRAEGRAQRLETVEEDARARVRPGINAAYRVAKAEGADLPKVMRTEPGSSPFMSPRQVETNIPAGFENIIDEPLLRPFWNRAERLVRQLENVEDQGDFARLDMFRSEMSKASRRTTDQTLKLALTQGVEDIEAAMARANISPGREGARQAHMRGQAEIDVANENATRIERHFNRTKQGLTGNSTTPQQSMDVARSLRQLGIFRDLGNLQFGTATAKIVAYLMSIGETRAMANSRAARMVEEARILVGRDLPTRPAPDATDRIRRGTSALAPTILLGGKSQELLGGPK
jgi:hypothetical protein